mgnify:CR=1 FL=1
MTGNRLKIAILGTRGIPNNYGGFEQFAEYLSVKLVEKGHSVTVYNPHHHEYDDSHYKSVKITKIYDPEKWIGSASQIFYDYFCLKDSIKNRDDIVIELGYQSSALSMFLLNIKNLKIITNMDGMEWKRQKWNWIVKFLTRLFEKIAVKKSDEIVVDSIGVFNYFKTQYGINPVFIPYGAVQVDEFDPGIIKKYKLNKSNYFLLIARIEPENNIEMIIEGVISSDSSCELVVIGNHQSTYGNTLFNKYSSNNQIKFLGGIYNKHELDSIRHFSKIYFHGHSIGGTNPSLLEAMAAGSFISAHRNEFNNFVLGNDGNYFSSSNEISTIIDNEESYPEKEKFVSNNLQKIKSDYNWDKITDEYEGLILKMVRVDKRI